MPVPDVPLVPTTATTLLPPTVSGRRGRYILATLAIGLGCEALYILSGQLAFDRPRPDPTLALDRLVPFLPESVWIYQAWALFLLLPAMVVQDLRRLERTLLAGVLACLLGYVTFLILPLWLPRPVLGESVSERVLGELYAFDRFHGGGYLPSLHVATAWIAAAGIVGGGLPRILGAFAVLGAAAITFSTVAIRQHVVLDALAGMLWAALWWRLAAPAHRALTRNAVDEAAAWRQLHRGTLRLVVAVVVRGMLAPALAWWLAGRGRPADAAEPGFLSGPAAVWIPLAAFGLGALVLALRRGMPWLRDAACVATFAAVACADGEPWRAGLGAPLYALLLVATRDLGPDPARGGGRHAAEASGLRS